jgi:hypothetical protein
MDGVTIKPNGHEQLLVTFPYSPRYTHATPKAMGRIPSPLDKLNLSSGKRTAEKGDVD